MQVIHRLTVLSLPDRVFEVGTEIDGHEVIEIKDNTQEFESSVHSEFIVLDENGDRIANIVNCPVIIDYKQIVDHDNEK